MVSARLTPEARAALVRQHLDDGVPLIRLAAAAGVRNPDGAALGRELPDRPDHRRAATADPQ